jgi:hypothetical protein
MPGFFSTHRLEIARSGGTFTGGILRTFATALVLVPFAASCTAPESANLDALRADEALRREVFARWMDATLRAETEARGLVLDPAEESLQSSDVYDIYDRNLAEVAREFGIPEVEVLAIQVEGLANGWPRPEP